MNLILTNDLKNFPSKIIVSMDPEFCLSKGNFVPKGRILYACIVNKR